MEQRDRQRASGTRHGALFWHEEQNNFGLKLMEGMGWKVGKGLGRKEEGNTNFIKTKYKPDNKGIGATDTTNDETWRASQDMFNDVLKKLRNAQTQQQQNGEKDVESAEDNKPAPTTTATSIKTYIARRTLYSRFKKAKDVSNYSAESMAEIFGRKPSSSPTPSSSPSPPPSPTDSENGSTNKSDIVTSTSTVSIRDYFAQKLAAKAASTSAHPGSSTRFNVSGGTSFNEDAQADYYDRMMHAAIGGTSGFRAHSGLGFQGAGTGANLPSHRVPPSPSLSSAPHPASASVTTAAHTTEEETEEQRKERKRLKKEMKREKKRQREASTSENTSSPAPAPSLPQSNGSSKRSKVNGDGQKDSDQDSDQQTNENGLTAEELKLLRKHEKKERKRLAALLAHREEQQHTSDSTKQNDEQEEEQEVKIEIIKSEKKKKKKKHKNDD